MMVIVGSRHTGKTFNLLKLSHATGIPIAVHSYQRLKQLERQAEQLHLKIPQPELVFTKTMARGTKRRAVLVDEAQEILQSAIGCDVEIVTVSDDAFGLCEGGKSLRSLLRYWWGLGEERKW